MVSRIFFFINDLTKLQGICTASHGPGKMPVSICQSGELASPLEFGELAYRGILSDSGVKPGFGKRSVFHGPEKFWCSEILTVRWRPGK